MTEIAFKVNKDSKFYRQYFDAKAEKQKLHDYAREFFAKHDLISASEYYQSEFLALQLTDEQKNRFKEQIKKGEDNNGMTRFKKKSAMQKEWTDNVISKVNMEVAHACRTWYWSYIMSGEYSLWDKDGEIYGYLMDKSKDRIELSNDLIPIKMSEYYTVKESFED